jgi:hypothetical protein
VVIVYADETLNLKIFVVGITIEGNEVWIAYISLSSREGESCQCQYH